MLSIIWFVDFVYLLFVNYVNLIDCLVYEFHHLLLIDLINFY